MINIILRAGRERAMSALTALSLMALLTILASETRAQSCGNVDLETGTLTGWTGTWGDGVCNGGTLFGLCVGVTAPDPYQYNGLNQGANNQAANAGPEMNHFIMTGGFDPIVGGTTLPVVYPGGGAYSLRLGNAQAEDGGETISTTFTVTNANSNFTYHYAAVLNDGGHPSGEQPFFQIRMYDGSNNVINCASFDVDASTAAGIGGFVAVGGILYNPWTPVFIPLNNYIGQTVRIEFITRDCDAGGGSHFAYAYIDASCQPLQIISSAPNVCGGQNITLNAPTGAATYSWAGPGVVSGGNAEQVTINAPGPYTVTMTTFGVTPCTFSLDTVIPPSPSNPTANFTYTPACAGDPIVFTDASSPAGQITNWAWDFDNNGTPDDMTQNPSYTFPATGTYPVRLGVAWPPCLADTTIDVTVLSVPTSPFTTTSPICLNQTSTVTYTGNAPANSNYTWDFDGGTVVSGSGQGPYEIDWATPGTKNITLEVALGSCVSSVTTTSVVVNALPVIDAGTDVAVCEGGSTPLSASGATTYSWDPPTGLSATTGASVTATPAATTTYTVTGTSAGCTGTDDVTVTVNPFPVVTVSPTTATVCAGTATTFTAGGATTYAWSPATGLSATTGTTVDAAPLASTTYTVTGTSLGCSSDATFDITVNPSPTMPMSNDTTVCEGNPVTLTTGGADTYAWSPGTGLSATNTASVVATPASTTTYTVVGTGLGCTTTRTVTITVNPYPSVSISPASFTMCVGENKDFTASGADSYVWSPALGISTTTDATVIADPVVSTTYEVVGSSLGCNDTATLVLTVNPIPVVILSNDTTICSGTSAPLTANGANSYVWSPATGLSATTGAAVLVSPMTTVTYTVTGTSLNCSSSEDVTVTVNQTPTVNVTPSATSYCDGDSTTLVASGADTYAWTPATDLSSPTGTSVTANPTTTTVYTVVGTTLGCTDDAVATVTVHPNPVVDFVAGPVEGCRTHCVQMNNLTTIASGSMNSYSWDMGDGNIITAHSPSHCYPDEGVYTIGLTATSNQGCVAELVMPDLITVHPLPTAFFGVNPTTASALNPRFEFTDMSTGAVEWHWAFGDGATLGTQTPSPTYTYPSAIDTGTYTVRLMVVNEFGCTDTISYEVIITPHVSIYIPNAFTPDNNAHNERFTAYGENIVAFGMLIFDRWGEQIFQTADMDEGWDGSYKGAQVESGVYVYRIDWTDINGDEGQRTGQVILVR
ncbi:MAG: PKD domain-containing protein [Flavobacteriales bacterium]|nr:PKD domain-containing protein [Flavobacteriales bacterium]